ncbi:MAG TPA: MgtC/SapB family protein [Niabella sp.]|nr:MgtC/SapB family protein [Niabella sp.]
MFDYWDIDDLYKALMALAAGIILGLERELKDKAAGLKTISLITLGSALFAIISYNIGQPNNESTRIASYIVSGIGFLGAGVIFKDGVNVSGLTTASVIWLASAVGMSIGFGQVYLALLFLGVSIILIHFGSIINSLFPDYKISRILMICMEKERSDMRQLLIDKMNPFLDKIEERKIKAKDDKICIFYDITLRNSRLMEFENLLLGQKEILEFEL